MDKARQLVLELQDIQANYPEGSPDREAQEDVIYHQLNELAAEALHTENPDTETKRLYFMIRHEPWPDAKVTKLPVYPEAQQRMFTKSRMTPHVHVFLSQMAQDLQVADGKDIEVLWDDPRQDAGKALLAAMLQRPDRKQWLKAHKKQCCKRCWRHVLDKLFQMLVEVVLLDLRQRLHQIEGFLQTKTLTEVDARVLATQLHESLGKVQNLTERTRPVTPETIEELFQIMVDNVNQITNRYVRLQQIHKSIQNSDES